MIVNKAWFTRQGGQIYNDLEQVKDTMLKYITLSQDHMVVSHINEKPGADFYI